MNYPTVKLIADIPKPLKKKLMRIALEKDVPIKRVIIDWLESLPDPEKKGYSKSKKSKK